MAYGAIFTSGTIGQALRDANKYYDDQADKIFENYTQGVNQLYQPYNSAIRDIELSANQQKEILTQDYTNALSQAYMSSRINQSNIYGSDFGSGMKSYLNESNNMALQKAYESYKNNYISGMVDIDKSATSMKSELQTMLDKNISNLYNAAIDETKEFDKNFNTKVENSKAFLNSGHDYLSYLYENNPDVFNRVEFQQFINDDGTLKTYDQIFNVKNGTLVADENGYRLTDKGKDIYRILLNNDANTSWGSYLAGSKSTEGLLEWLMTGSEGYKGSNLDEIFSSVLGIDDTNEMYKDQWTVGDVNPETGYGEKITVDDFKNGLNITSDNIVTNEYLGTYTKNKIANNGLRFYIDDSKYSDGMTMDEFAKSKNELIAKQNGEINGKRGSIFDKVLASYKSGSLKDGTIFDVNYGKGANYYIFKDGKVYALQTADKIYANDIKHYAKQYGGSKNSVEYDDARNVVDINTDNFGPYKSGSKQDDYSEAIKLAVQTGQIQEGQYIVGDFGQKNVVINDKEHAFTRDKYMYVGNGVFVPITLNRSNYDSEGIFVPEGYEYTSASQTIKRKN
jgi:hypothetical protein